MPTASETTESRRAHLPPDFGSGRDCRGGNAVHLAMNALDRGYAAPRRGGYR